ncbi:MAG TPA: hypothetical protein VL588_06835 [Bdellovibrionota bacterium]|nr:hypothetical protein [Bdellovibrionota bacterium]
MSRVLVLEAYRQTLTVIRSLAAAGWTPVLGHELGKEDDEYTAACRASRHLGGTVALPPSSAGTIYAHAVEEVLKNDSSIVAVLPVGEESLRSIMTREKEIRALRTLVAPSGATVSLCLDKPRANAAAAQAGLHVCDWKQVRDAQGFEKALAEVGYPLVVKPVDSFARVADRKALILDDAAERARLLPEWPGDAGILLVQSKSPGLRHNCMFHARGGKLTQRFESRVLRTDDPEGTGYGVESVSVALDPMRWKWVERFVQQLSFDGPGCVQFLVDGTRSDFLEINPRLDASVVLAWHCGVDLPASAVASAVSLDPSAVPVAAEYEPGRRLEWTLGDVAGALQALRARRSSLGETLRWLARAAVSSIWPSARMTWAWTDPRPTVLLATRFAGSILKVLVRR